jgi:hypothetical protein
MADGQEQLVSMQGAIAAGLAGVTSAFDACRLAQCDQQATFIIDAHL